MPIIYRSLFIDKIFSYQSLYDYQMSKIREYRDVNTVFLGDSSLGNAINSECFTSLSGLKSVNLALTAMYGYAGGYNMLKKISKNNPLKNVIMLQAIDMQKRETAYDGYIYTIEEFSDFLELSFYEKIETIRYGVNILLSFNNLKRIFIYYILGRRQSHVIKNDYVAQDTFVISPKDSKPLTPEINPDKIRFLKKIIFFCKKRNINLIYIHGPILENTGRASLNYISMANKAIRKSGVTLVDMPIFIPYTKIGDSEDHVHPRYKDEFTRIYFELLRNRLK